MINLGLWFSFQGRNIIVHMPLSLQKSNSLKTWVFLNQLSFLLWTLKLLLNIATGLSMKKCVPILLRRAICRVSIQWNAVFVHLSMKTNESEPCSKLRT